MSIRRDLMEMQAVLEIGEALSSAIDDVTEFPDCRTCGCELDVFDENDSPLETPQFYCRECEQLVERPDYYEEVEGEASE